MQRLYLNRDTLNRIFSGEEQASRRVGKIKVDRRYLEELLKKEEGKTEIFLSVFLATDAKTGKMRVSRSGDMVFNIKPQRPREEHCEAIGQPTGVLLGSPEKESEPDHAAAWKE